MFLEHEPVLLNEVIRLLRPENRRIYVDCTVGCGGHSERILEESKPEGFFLGVDLDEKALDFARKRLEPKFSGRFKLVKERFERLDKILESLNIEKVDGILMDLGLNSIQIDEASRGFSFRGQGPLDMRFDQNQKIKALDIINNYSFEELEKIIREYGEESWSRKIAQKILETRSQARIETTLDLSSLIKKTIPKKFWNKRIDVSTKTFQAIRIAVNQELEGLGETIRKACDHLNNGHRLIILTYHSLEDRIVKRTFDELSKDCICSKELPICVCNHKKTGVCVNPESDSHEEKATEKTSSGKKGSGKKKFLTPTEDEIKKNPRSRSAKLRVFERKW
jgi:16S rRNA (cytosine1402-N4)-methyltransferase